MSIMAVFRSTLVGLVLMATALHAVAAPKPAAKPAAVAKIGRAHV